MGNQTVILKNAGLQTYPNQLTYINGSSVQSSTPQGSLAQADDVVINRENVIESRRGFQLYGNAMGGSPTIDTAHQQMSYKNRLFRHWGPGVGTTLDYDDGSGNYTSFSATISEVIQGIRIKYAESNGNLYFTTSTGIQKISIANASQLSSGLVQQAGISEGLDITLSLNSAQGFFNQESVVAYRTLWGINDPNQNLILGSPSNRQIISNPLTPLLITNFNALLIKLDTLTLSSGIHFQNYSSTFNTPMGSAASLLRSNLIALATELDTDIATNSNFNMTPNVINITGTTNSTNTMTVTSVTGIATGQQISGTAQVAKTGVSGTTTANSPIITSTSGFSVGQVFSGQLVTAVTSGILPANTYVISVDGSLNITLSNVPVINNAFVNEFSFTNPNPIPSGTIVTNISGTTLTLSNSATFSATYTTGFNFSSIYTQQNTNASSYITTIILTTNPSSILQLNDHVSITNLNPGTYNINTGTVQLINNISGANNVVITYPTNPGTYISGNAKIIRYKYQAIPQPITLDLDPTTNELLSMQVYYDTIVGYLQVEPSLIITSPSIFNNSNSTKSSTVNITFPIPSGITTADFYQIYRTQQLAGSTGTALDTLDPGDEESLAYEGNPTSLDITNGYITIQDITPDSFLGAYLYTNANSGTGILSANTPPPLAQDLVLYKNYMFYANTTSNHSVNTALLGVSAFVPGTSTLTIANGSTSNTYTFIAGANNPALKQVHISTLPTPAQQIAETAQSLVNVINRNPNELIYAFYESGVTGVPGKILLKSRGLGAAAFYLNANSTGTGNAFSPAIPVSGQVVISTNDTRPNRLFYSAQFQPDGVPIVNTLDIGPQDKAILRIVSLRESLFVFKEEGIYLVTGQSAPFTTSLFDSSTVLNSPDSPSVLNNTIYCLSNQGVVSVNDTGVSIISRPIEGSLIVLNKALYPNFQTSTWGIGYESDRTYNLWTVTNTSDVLATQGFRYNTITQAWTRCTKTARCGVVNYLDDRLYLGATDTNYIEQERKNFDRTDYADRQYTITLGANAVNGNVITLPSSANISVGDVVQQVQYLTLNQYNRCINKLDNDPGTHLNYLTLLASSGYSLRNSLTLLATQLVADSGTNTKTYLSAISGYTASFSDTQAAFNVIVNLLNLDSGLRFKNYMTSNNTTSYEVPIISITGSKITTQYPYNFIQGPIIVYNHIRSVVTWLPESFGDPSISKHVSEATCIFNKQSITSSTLSFSSDLFPSYYPVIFPGPGNGSYGNGIYGNTTYGDSGNSAPLRTLIPRDYQRCRNLNVQFNHAVAREMYQIYGISMTYNSVSQRAWR